MKNILIVNTSGMGIGGIATHMINYLNAIIKEVEYNLQFTIVVTGVRDEKILKKFENMGCKLEFLSDRKGQPIKYVYELKQLIKKNSYDVIHVHGNSSTMGIELYIAKSFKIPIRIAHCHNSKCEHSKLHKLLNLLFAHSYTKAVACSKLAGNWIFGANNFIVLPNAIEYEKFRYNSAIREQYREKMKIEKDTILVGHVGNFNDQKNQTFLIDIYNILQKKVKSELILIGIGPLEAQMKNKVQKLNLEKKVHFLEARDDVNYLMQAMDVFVLPSKWEGFGIVLIEAQASGLYVVASTEAPKDTCVTENIRYISLLDGKEKWCDEILNGLKDYKRKVENTSGLENYSLKKSINTLKKLYNIDRGK